MYNIHSDNKLLLFFSTNDIAEMIITLFKSSNHSIIVELRCFLKPKNIAGLLKCFANINIIKYKIQTKKEMPVSLRKLSSDSENGVR